VSRAVSIPVSPPRHRRAMRTDRHLLSLHLEREWRTLRTRPDAVARARSWGVTDGAFSDLDGLLRLAGFGAAHTASGNEVLRRLARLGRHDELAARVVLQRVLPGLLATVARRRRSPDGAFEELVGAAWVTIRASRTRWDHEQVAANIVRDAAYRAFTAPFRRRSASEIAVDPHTLEEKPAVCQLSPGEELATLLAEARAEGVSTEDLDLVRELVVVGSPGRVAAQRQVTARTVRNHRDRATARLRRVACDAA
jgi:hypothetical protein